MTILRRATLLVLLLCLPAALHGQKPRKRFFQVMAGGAAPAYVVRTVAGDSVRLEDLTAAGQVVLLNVWATWCPPCRAEMPELQRIHESFGPYGLTLLGVSVDTNPFLARHFLRANRITYLNAIDRMERLTGQFGFVQAVPQTILIDREGTVVAYWIGPFDRERAKEVHARLRALLPSAPEAGKR